jgi:hypothetical protein
MRSTLRTSIDDATRLLLRLGAGVIAATALFCAATSTQAQAQDQSTRAAGEACARIADSLERLMCYDREFRPAAAVEAIGAPASTAATAPGVASAPAASAPAAPVAAAPIVVAPTASAPPTAAVAASPPPAPAAPSARAADPAPIPIVVVSIREVRGGDSRFTTEDGQVWIQTDGRRNVYPDLPFPAEIKPGAMGSVFLVPSNGRGVRVRRGE